MNVQNRTIFEGDNLYILRGLDSASIDLIYLDPPFNSNRNYAAPIGSKAAGAAFKDTWTLSDIDNAWQRRNRRARTRTLSGNTHIRTDTRQIHEVLSDYDGDSYAGNETSAKTYREYLPTLRPDSPVIT